MSVVQKQSVTVPARISVNRLLFEASRRAEAMGLVASNHVPSTDLKAVRHLATQVGKAGIASATVAALNNVEALSQDDVAGLLKTIIVALEASPVPTFEWAGVARVLDAEERASLLHVSLSSLKRYRSDERATPDAIAARLHFLALVVGDLAGSYNNIGIRRWFTRKRRLLDGRAPADVLKGEWDPDDPGPLRVRELARELVGFSAT